MNMKNLFPLLIIAAFFSNEALSQSVTYNDNIACILFTRCTSCHNEGGIAPFSLMTYDDATAAAFGIQGAVNAGSMPPWPPDSDYR
jgi:hypothetical protein